MQLKHATTTDINMAELLNAAKNGVVSVGDRILIGDCEWKALEVTDKTMMIWKCKGPAAALPINKFGSNVYEGSDMQKYLREEFPQTVPEELREVVTEEGFFLLSLEEVKKYMPRPADRVFTNEDGEPDWWWTRSATRGFASCTWSVSTGGSVCYHGAYRRFSLRPGLHNPINLIISAHTCAGEGGKP